MNIALIQLPHFYGDNLSRPPETYPLGIGYLSNALMAAKIQHQAIDLWTAQLPAEKAVDNIDYSKFDFLCVSAYVTQYKYLKQFTLALKSNYPDIPIICGGPGPTYSYEVILTNTGVDVCVLGEGEMTLVDLINNYPSVKQVRGIAFLDHKEVIKTSNRDPIKNLDDLPFPNRALFKVGTLSKAETQRIYQGQKPKSFKIISTDIIAGRGCPYKCHYCSKTFEKVRLRSIDNIIAEIEQLIKKENVNHLQFNDELVFVNKKRSMELCKRLKPLNLTWSCQGRIDQVDKALLTAAKEAGCIEIGYGVESTSQEILNNMNKKLDAKDIVPVINMTKLVGIKPIVQYMYGYEGENDATISATIQFFKEIDHPYIGFTVVPIPGTKLYNDCLKKGLIDNEEDYILRLDSGYNMEGSRINLTQFTDHEFLAKKRKLKMIVNHNYLIKRPVDYIKYILAVLQRKLFRMIHKVVKSRSKSIC
jgi:anaerobic magnesium-protoporphyrin IX monomethyl ester cyclase